MAAAAMTVSEGQNAMSTDRPKMQLGPSWRRASDAARDAAASDDLRGIDVHFSQKPHSLLTKSFSFRLEITNRSAHERRLLFRYEAQWEFEEMPIVFRVWNRNNRRAFEDRLAPEGPMGHQYHSEMFQQPSTWALTLQPGETWSQEWTWRPFLWLWRSGYRAQVDLRLDPLYEQWTPGISKRQILLIPVRMRGPAEVRLPLLPE